MKKKKFRAWHYEKGNPMYKPYMAFSGISLELFFRNVEYEPCSVEVMEYINQPDKEGVEIYEGDIVDIYEKRWNDDLDDLEEIVVGRDVVTLEHFRLWLKNESFGHEGESLVCPDDTKIVGNIHEDENLLNGLNGE